ncbi:MAG: hypothetical protein JWP62_2815 [Blastococcus sp.]|nr:hypothetical protein [Blastococcus sp.]
MPAAVRPTGRARSDPADDLAVRQARTMATPEPPMPQPRDIALEQETPEQAADLEAQSDDETAESSEES